MALYSDIVMDHFMHPRNVGEIENPDGVGHRYTAMSFSAAQVKRWCRR